MGDNLAADVPWYTARSMAAQYSKDFGAWNSQKRKRDTVPRVYYHEREIWWCALGLNIGWEMDGKGGNFTRPVVIIRGFNAGLFVAVALTSKSKTGNYYMPLGRVGDTDATAVLSQVRVLDTKRLVRKIGTLDQVRFDELKRRVGETLAL